MENEEKREEQIMPYILNFEDGVRTLFAKYKAKELELQQECHEFSCKYRYDSGRNCAIGAMLPKHAFTTRHNKAKLAAIAARNVCLEP